MFESIVVRRMGEDRGPIDPGLIAETLLFYQNTHLLLERGSLDHLLRKIGPDCLLRLMRDHGTKVTYLENSMGTHTKIKSGIPVHTFMAFSPAGDKETGLLTKREEIIHFVFERSLGSSSKVEKYSRAFLETAQFSSMAKGFGHKKGLVGVSRDDLKNDKFLKEAVKIAIKGRIPDYEFPADWHFKIIDYGEDFIVADNLDYDELTHTYQKALPGTDIKITPAQIINDVSQGSIDLRLSANYASEYATNNTASLIAQARLERVVNVCANQADEVHLFQNIILDSAASIRESINSGNRSFDEFLDLLGKSKKFKDWVGDINPDKGLLKQYNDELIAGSWLDKLAPKSIRFVVATGLGIVAELVAPTGIGTAAGVAFGAGDVFLLDKLMKGWNPSHFVSGPLKNFTE